MVNNFTTFPKNNLQIEKEAIEKRDHLRSKLI